MSSDIEKPSSSTAQMAPVEESSGSAQRCHGERHLQMPRGFLGMLALVLAFELFLKAHDHEFRDVAQWNFSVSRRQAESAKGKYDLVCFGDSVMKMAVIPKIIDAKLGRHSYNMAVCGSQAPETFFLLRRMIESGAKPSAVIVNFFPRLQELGPWHCAEFWHYSSLRDTIELCCTARDATLFGVVMSKRILPSYALRMGIRAELMGAFKGQPGFTRKNAWGFRMMWAQDKGAQLLPGNTNPTEDFVMWQKAYFGRRWFDPTNVAFIHRFLKLAAANDIPVFWILTPVKAGLQTQCEASGFDADYTRYLQAVSACFPNVTVVDARHSGMDRKLFFDPHHLGKDGAKVFSRVLGDILSQHFHSSKKDRWLQLVARESDREDADPPLGQRSAVAATGQGLDKRRN